MDTVLSKDTEYMRPPLAPAQLNIVEKAAAVSAGSHWLGPVRTTNPSGV